MIKNGYLNKLCLLTLEPKHASGLFSFFFVIFSFNFISLSVFVSKQTFFLSPLSMASKRILLVMSVF